MKFNLFNFNKAKFSKENQTRNVDNVISDIQEKDFWEIYNFCKPYTMTSIERMYALYKAVLYVLRNNIEGDFIECGVWRGGSSMLIAKMLNQRQVNNKKLFMFDTFEGMSEPTQYDVDYHGENAKQLLTNSSKDDPQSIWCFSGFEEVYNNIMKTGLSPDQFSMIKGKVEDTIPEKLLTKNIALLRLDTDFYESTKHELIHLFPLLKDNGVIVIDDYGHWQGCRKAVDEYFETNKIDLLLNRIDNTGRIGIKNKPITARHGNQ
jgi:hypothetical protein